MRVNPYLLFDGRCEEACAFYVKAIGAEIRMMMTNAHSPMAAHVPPAWKDKIMHASLAIGDTILMASDGRPGAAEPPSGFSVSLLTETDEEAERAFAGLAEGGTVTMPIQETFWTSRFGTLIDKFGVPWMVNCDKAR